MFLLPEEYGQTPVKTLLLEAAKGRTPVDHLLLRSLLARPDETAAAIDETARLTDAWRFDFTEDLLALARHLNDPRSLSFLIDLLEDEEPPDAVYEAFSALGKAAAEPLLEAFASSQSPHFRENAAFALAALGVEDLRIEQAIQEADPDGVARQLYEARGESPVPAFDIFEKYPEEGIPIVELLPLAELVELLDCPREEWRIVAAASLYRENLAPAQIQKLFERAKTDASETVRAHLWQALEVGLDQDEIVAEMIRRLEDPSTPDTERGGLCVGLAPIADRPPVLAAIETLYTNPRTRLKALEAMWRSELPEFAPRFPPHLEDPHSGIRRIALRGIAVHGLVSELGRVRKMLGDEDVREDALYAYARLAPAKNTPAYLRTLYEKITKEAGGLDRDEDQVVRLALDQRLEEGGRKPVFLAELE